MNYNVIKFTPFERFNRVFCDVTNHVGLSLHGAIDLCNFYKDNGYVYLRLFQYEHATFEGRFITSVMTDGYSLVIFYEEA